MENDDLKNEFELREKRLKLVYKILYVVVILWVALFLSYTSNKTVSYAPMFCGILSLLTTSILNILFYAFGELRCMKIHDPTEDFEKESTDNKFLNILDTFSVSLLPSFVLFLVNILFPAVINKWSISVSIFIIGSSLIVFNTLYNKNIKVKSIINNIIVPVIWYAFFAIAQLS
jgi:hypothetical protein